MKVIIDPEDDIQYMSFYVKGLIDRFGHSNVMLSTNCPLPTAPHAPCGSS